MTDQARFSRETAKLCSIKDLLSGEYIVLEGWQPNHVLVGKRKISRINILGVVVEKPSSFQFLIDDGTATIQVTDFNQNKNTQLLQVGDPVLVIGRPRKAEETLFIASEIVNPHQLKQQPQWLAKRKKELSSLPKTETEKTETTQPKINKPQQPKKEHSQQLTGDDLVDHIKKKDTGEGVLIEELVEYFGEEADEVVLTLLSMGEIYEIKPGRVKFLE